MSNERVVRDKKDMQAKREEQPQTLGFGVPATSDPHHFKVIIPKANTGRVQISEYLGLQTQSIDLSVVDRVSLERTRCKIESSQPEDLGLESW